MFVFFPQDLGSDTTYRTVLRCSKTDESESDAEGNCEAEVQGHTSNPASLEVAAIADTDDDYLVDTLVNEQKFINFELRRLFFCILFGFHYQFTIFANCSSRRISAGRVAADGKSPAPASSDAAAVPGAPHPPQVSVHVHLVERRSQEYRVRVAVFHSVSCQFTF